MVDYFAIMVVDCCLFPFISCLLSVSGFVQPSTFTRITNLAASDGSNEDLLISVIFFGKNTFLHTRVR